jgi:hypothetical protein
MPKLESPSWTKLLKKVIQLVMSPWLGLHLWSWLGKPGLSPQKYTGGISSPPEAPSRRVGIHWPGAQLPVVSILFHHGSFVKINIHKPSKKKTHGIMG